MYMYIFNLLYVPEMRSFDNYKKGATDVMNQKQASDANFRAHVREEEQKWYDQQQSSAARMAATFAKKKREIEEREANKLKALKSAEQLEREEKQQHVLTPEQKAKALRDKREQEALDIKKGADIVEQLMQNKTVKLGEINCSPVWKLAISEVVKDIDMYREEKKAQDARYEEERKLDAELQAIQHREAVQQERKKKEDEATQRQLDKEAEELCEQQRSDRLHEEQLERRAARQEKRDRGEPASPDTSDPETVMTDTEG